MQDTDNHSQLLRTSQNLQTSLISRDTLTQEHQLKLNQNDQSIQTPSQSTRLNSLDFHRGLTVFGMIMANCGGDNAPWFMQHAEWDGLTPVDLIFPSFMFIMGMAVPLAITSNKPVKLKNILRVLGLFLIGQFLYLYDAHFDFTQLRIPGVMQRLSLSYGCMILIHWATDYGNVTKRIYGTLAICSGFFIFIAYIISFKSSQQECLNQTNLTPFCNFTSYIDRAVFGKDHMIYPHDPQGIFSTLPGFFTTYIGYYFCLIMKDNKSQIKKTLRSWLIICFILGLTVYPLTKLMPLNKKMYSASFAVLTACVAGVAIVLFVIVVDLLPKWSQPGRRIVDVCITPFIWMGRNPLFIYVLSELFSTTVEDYIKINGESMDECIQKYVFNSWVGVAAVSAELKSFLYLLIFLVPTFILFKRNIFIRL